MDKIWIQKKHKIATMIGGGKKSKKWVQGEDMKISGELTINSAERGVLFFHFVLGGCPKQIII
jgi:hypothetical protein